MRVKNNGATVVIWITRGKFTVSLTHHGEYASDAPPVAQEVHQRIVACAEDERGTPSWGQNNLSLISERMSTEFPGIVSSTIQIVEETDSTSEVKAVDLVDARAEGINDFIRSTFARMDGPGFRFKVIIVGVVIG